MLRKLKRVETLNISHTLNPTPPHFFMKASPHHHHHHHKEEEKKKKQEEEGGRKKKEEEEREEEERRRRRTGTSRGKEARSHRQPRRLADVLSKRKSALR